MSNDFLTIMPQDFRELGLTEPLLRALDSAGYTEPTPIQSKMIPHVLAGKDVVGQAQTGTGKTAAFALPLLSRIQPVKKARPKVLVLAPTRELAIQVSDSFKQYGTNMKQLRVLPIYGGQDYVGQLQQLDRGVHVVVGTPGRVMDHIRRGSLDLSTIESIVLDEADEMLKMGFLEDVEWILDQAPKERQIALFSATMPPSIRRIAVTHLNEPIEITIQNKTATASTISQQYLIVKNFQLKKEALNRILEIEEFEGMLIFVRTKMQTVELAEQLSDLGYSCAALNGDIAQSQRVRTVEQLKSGKLDILVATDVAARGLDVERVSHVVNYDVPFDAEAYIHRIGRTGRAGREGKAILFLTPRERSMLKSIERASRKRIEQIELPSVKEINQKRIAAYKNRITETLSGNCDFFSQLISEYCQETETSAEDVAAALAKIAQGKTPLLLKDLPKPAPRKNSRDQYGEQERGKRSDRKVRGKKHENHNSQDGFDRYRIEVGEVHGVRPANIVGAIANEADISSEYIGRISIFEDYSTVDLPNGMPKPVLRMLQNVRVNGRLMRTRIADDQPDGDNFGNDGRKTRSDKPRRNNFKKGPRQKSLAKSNSSRSKAA
ncbi:MULTISPECIES: DEAD/DEAH box helicase [Desulfosediminicola]|uniref:DEAD/DEAH box helicase n=1 Tax=Desulfosediminicola TaxID=2886823 RepID=UPI0010AD7D60|nr:DEAD/DEAH box helicase [Desulfosediminicola ganghwensis]